MGRFCASATSLPATGVAVQQHLAVGKGEQRPVAASANVLAGDKFTAALADDDAAGGDNGAAIFFDAETFADAIARYGKTLQDDYLLDAYRKVGMAFKGQLEQHFVVLKDLNVERMLVVANEPSRFNRPNRGNYRGRPRS